MKKKQPRKKNNKSVVVVVLRIFLFFFCSSAFCVTDLAEKRHYVGNDETWRPEHARRASKQKITFNLSRRVERKLMENREMLVEEDER